MKLLGIDYGKKKIGLAFAESFLPSPLSVIQVKTEKQALSEIIAVCERLGIEKVVLGLSGGIHDKETRAFAKKIEEQTHVPIAFVDETFTSRLAVSKMVEGHSSKKKRRILEDAVAATLILTVYLEKEEESTHNTIT